MFFDLFFPALFSFAFTLTGTLLALKFFPKLGLMDRPEKYGHIRAPIPYSGGLIIFFSFLFSTLIFLDIDAKVLGLISGALLIAFVSFWDDRFFLSPWIRLAAQIIAGIIVVFSGVKIQLLTNPFGDPFFLDSIKLNIFGQEIWLFSLIFIVIWLVLVMNVMNWLDGLQGLSSGVGVIAALITFFLSIQGFHTIDQSVIVTLSFSLFFSLLAFWIFEFPPAKILMGDTGSMLIGFLLGVFAIFSGGKVATLLLILGFPVFDAFWVILRRILARKSPFEGDLKHFHHRLLRAGLSEKSALFLNYALCLVFGGIALFAGTTRGKFIALLAVFVMITITGSVTYLFERKGSGNPYGRIE